MDMILGLEKQRPDKPAAIDTDGNSVSYGDLIGFSCEISKVIAPSSLVFLMAKNNVGGIAWTISLLESENCIHGERRK